VKTRSGQCVTEAMVKALAKEAEAGYDPRTLRPKRVGRPSLGRGISPRVQVRFNPQAHAQLQKAALARKQTVSAYIRALVEERLGAAKKSRRRKAAG
jgi:predicted HicB family RNase H-like nuclease